MSLGRLMAAKARAWSLIVGAGGPGLRWSFDRIAAGGRAGLRRHGASGGGGAVGMTWLAVALACHAADLSDDHRPALGPAAIYRFSAGGGLFNLVLAGDATTRVRGLLLYALAIAAFWATGMKRATSVWIRSDAPTRTVAGRRGDVRAVWISGRARPWRRRCGWAVHSPRAGQPHRLDGDQRGVGSGGGDLRGAAAAVAAGLRGWRALPVALGCRSDHERGAATEPGAASAAVWRDLLVGSLASPAVALGALAVTAIAIVCDELVFRAMIQRALQNHFRRAPVAFGWDVWCRCWPRLRVRRWRRW